MSSTRLGLIRCEHCQRQFNPHSAARHIPWCQKRQHDARRHRLSAEKQQALERYKWRINYKPTNILHQQTPPSPRAQASKQRTSASINSSATPSSAETGSSTSSLVSSFGFNAQASNLPATRQRGQSGNGGGGCQGANHHTRASPFDAEMRRRSLSSVSLATQKRRQQAQQQQGSASSKNSQASGATITRQHCADADAISCQQLATRAKSASDLANMSEIVEVLAKRMEQIYAQNKLLLERIAQNRSQSSSSQGGAPDGLAGLALNSDADEANLVRCHHCNTSCLSEANYCHQCGCKMMMAIRGDPIERPETSSTVCTESA